MNVNILHLNNNIWVLILPAVMNPFNIFLFRNFVKSIPHDLVESARIDGAGDFKIYYKVIMPLAKPAVATIGLFLALGYWNEWFRCNLYIKNTDLYTLQYFLQSMMANLSAMMSEKGLVDSVASLPGETMKLATAIIATGPVLLFYPFVQRYFVGGLTIGGVKADAEAGIRIAIFSSGMQTGRMGLMYNKKGGSGMKRRMITVKNVWKKAVAWGRRQFWRRHWQAAVRQIRQAVQERQAVKALQMLAVRNRQCSRNSPRRNPVKLLP